MSVSLYLHVLLWVLVIIQGVVVCALVYQLAQLRDSTAGTLGLTVTGAQLRDPFPNFSATDLHSNSTVSSGTLRGRAKVFLFLTMSCGHCKDLFVQLSSVAQNRLDGLVIVCGGAERGCRNYAASFAQDVPVLHASVNSDEDTGRISELLRLSPIAVLVDEKWQVAGFRSAPAINDVLRMLGGRANNIDESAIAARA